MKICQGRRRWPFEGIELRLLGTMQTDEITNSRILYTIVGGKVVYEG
jgi:hypothetical protein